MTASSSTPPDLLAGVTTAQLAGAYLRGIEEKPVPVIRLNHVTVDAVSVAETVVSLSQRLPAMGSLSFRALTESLGSRIEIIVHFLALLELCKLGLVELGQGSTFGDVRSRGSTREPTSTSEGWTSMRDEFSLEQKLEAMLTVALEPISAEELADVVEADAEDVATTLRRPAR